MTNFLDSAAYGLRNFVITNTPHTNDYLQIAVTKTNGTVVTLSVTNLPGNTSTPGLIQSLISAINANASLMAADGLVAEDFMDYTIYQYPPINGGEFNLRARTAGWPASEILVDFSGSPDLDIFPIGIQALNQNISDLEPRNHLYVTAGVTNLSLAFPLDTTTLSDGYHELTAVVYEGSHVRTQTRVSQTCASRIHRSAPRSPRWLAHPTRC